VALETDLLLDRRRLKRRLVFWRSFSVLAVALAVFVSVRDGGSLPTGPHVARLSVTGIIAEDRKLTEAIDRLATDNTVKALIVAIDSPAAPSPAAKACTTPSRACTTRNPSSPSCAGSRPLPAT